MSVKSFLLDNAGDAVYQYFDPIRSFFVSLFSGPRKYRVTYRFDNGMSISTATETFNASHDREARMRAREIAGQDVFDLETYRKVKVL